MNNGSNKISNIIENILSNRVINVLEIGESKIMKARELPEFISYSSSTRKLREELVDDTIYPNNYLDFNKSNSSEYNNYRIMDNVITPKLLNNELDCIIFSIGIDPKSVKFEDIDDDELLNTMYVNTLGHMLLIRNILKYYITNQLTNKLEIIFINSITTIQERLYRDHLAYVLSKKLLDSFQQELSKTYSHLNIEFSSIYPPYLKDEEDYIDQFNSIINIIKESFSIKDNNNHVTSE